MKQCFMMLFLDETIVCPYLYFCLKLSFVCVLLNDAVDDLLVPFEYIIYQNHNQFE